MLLAALDRDGARACDFRTLAADMGVKLDRAGR
jgi:hypothetical protein